MKQYAIILNADEACEMTNVLIQRTIKLQKKNKLDYCEQLELLKLYHLNVSIKKQIQMQNKGDITIKIHEVEKNDQNK